MLLTLTSSTAPARDLGYLLRKHPDRLQEFGVPFGKAYVFYPQADDDCCTAAVLLDVDPVGLVRGRAGAAESGGPIDAYVNDRPYAASSFLSVAIARVLGTALGGRCDRPELANRELDLSATISPVRESDDDLARRLFEPLGYEVGLRALDVPETARAGTFGSVTIHAQVTLKQLLTHLYVLIPVIDGDKHYWVGDEEVEKLMRFGESWLPSHPERELITRRYLKRAPGLARAAVARLDMLEAPSGEGSPAKAGVAREDALERPLRLQERRLTAVAEVLRADGVGSVVDIGCGEGDLLVEIARDANLTRLVGVDVSMRELERANARLARALMTGSLRDRIELFQSSALYYDRRLTGIDAATLLEVVEHIDAARLPSLERVIFGETRPRLVVVTTPNSDYNVRFPRLLSGAMRHPDHRFEWTRAQFAEWTGTIAQHYGYAATIAPIGDVDNAVGAPTQMAVFRCV
ncbi:MAG TPA: 3' terminal RNA ribose 2'-O-methyltransferase Hen1 [Candidatus Baltobacteraceae bacterium]